MDSYSELQYMETSCQLLQICEEITSLTKQKEAIERRIKEKQYEEADLCKINLHFIEIIQKTKGADNYSPEKQVVKACTPSKKKCLELESPSTSSCPPPDIHRQPINLGCVKKSKMSNPFDFVLICVYRPPAKHICDFSKDLCSLVDCLNTVPLCIVGDFNEDILLNNNGYCYTKLTNLNLNQVVNTSTHVTVVH